MAAPPQQDLLPKLARYLDYFQALAEVGKSLTAELNVADVLETIMQSISQILQPENWSLLFMDEATEELYFEICVGDAADKIKGLRLKLGEGIAGWVALHKEPLLVPNVGKDPRFSRRMDQASRFQTAGVLCVPLLSRGETLGVIELVKDAADGEPFSEEHLQVLQLFSDFAAIAISNARSFQKVELLTQHDDWTGLYNVRFMRRHLQEEAARSRRYRHPLSLIFFDLDEFKGINDLHGHSVGSKLLREVAQKALGAIRETDKAVRYGGDEFVVVLPETAKESAVVVAEGLRRVIRTAEVATEQGPAASVSASFGVATFPDDAADPAGLVEIADRAMYLAKAHGRNAVVDATDVQAQPKAR